MHAYVSPPPPPPPLLTKCGESGWGRVLPVLQISTWAIFHVSTVHSNRNFPNAWKPQKQRRKGGVRYERELPHFFNMNKFRDLYPAFPKRFGSGSEIENAAYCQKMFDIIFAVCLIFKILNFKKIFKFVLQEIKKSKKEYFWSVFIDRCSKS